MLDELQRQIEIAALVCEFPEKYSEADLAHKFHTSEASIRRDMKALRDLGVTIHSRKHAYRIELEPPMLNRLITAYFAFGNNESIKNLPLIVERFQHKTLGFFIQTVRAIQARHTMEIDYRSAYRDEYQWRTITPVSFYNAGKTHYLIAIHRDTPKMFTLERIRNFRFTGQKSTIKEIPTLAELFRYSWGSFTGGKLTKVVLLFKDNVESYMAEKFWVEDQKLRQTDDGLEVTMQVKISNEFVAWVMGWGNTVTVKEPKELMNTVLDKARSIVSHYYK